MMPAERKAQVANTGSNIGCQPREKLSLPTWRKARVLRAKLKSWEKTQLKPR